MFCPNCGSLLRPGRDRCDKCNGRSTRSSSPSVDYFPFDKVRPGQREFMDDTASSIRLGSHLMAHAPTGIGKTAGVLAPAVKEAVEKGRTVLFTTSKQAHHRIAVETIREIAGGSGTGIKVVDIIGKQSMCPRPEARLPHGAFTRVCRNAVSRGKCPQHKADNTGVIEAILPGMLHAQELIDLAEDAGVCPHKSALQASSSADVIICDYNYVFSDLAGSVLEAMEVSLSNSVVIIDEAHNLPDRIMDGMRVWINTATLDEALSKLRGKKDLIRPIERLRVWLDEALEVMESGSEAEIDKLVLLEPMASSFRERIDGELDLPGYIAKLDSVSVKGEGVVPISRVVRFLQVWDLDMKGMVRYLSRRDMDRAEVELMDPSAISGPIFEAVRSALLMSGTLHPSDMYLDLLGLPSSRTLVRSYTSPFPPENVLLLSVGSITTRYKDRGERMYTKYGQLLSSIIMAIPGGTAVYFPSYDLMDRITERLDPDARAVAVLERQGMSKDEREELYLGVVEGTDRNALFGVIGGPLAEGMDFRGNSLKGVVVAGLPLPPRTLALEAKERYYDQRFGKGKGQYYGYYYPAMNRVVQAAGRMIRSESDRGAVILLDERYDYSMYRRCFPATFRYVNTENPVPVLEGFFLKG